MSTTRLVVAAAIVDDLSQPRLLLAARRSAPVALAGRWEFPGGKVEPGEDPVAALHREITEELGVTVVLGSEVPGPESFGLGEHGQVVGGAWPLAPATAERGPLVMRLWFASIVAGDPVPLEDHDELRWLEPGGWRDVAWLDADLAVVEAVIGHAVEAARRGWC